MLLQELKTLLPKDQVQIVNKLEIQVKGMEKTIQNLRCKNKELVKSTHLSSMRVENLVKKVSSQKENMSSLLKKRPLEDVVLNDQAAELIAENSVNMGPQNKKQFVHIVKSLLYVADEMDGGKHDSCDVKLKKITQALVIGKFKDVLHSITNLNVYKTTTK